MTPSQAATKMGCCTRHVRTLINTGRLRATATHNSCIPLVWEITPAAIRDYERSKQARGYPRGKPRNQGAKS